MEWCAERPGHSYGEAFWRAVRALYEEAFPGLPAGIDRAAHVGVRWAEHTTPFALFEGERCVAHVGVLTHPMRFGGRIVNVAGVHAVCTAADRRRRGLCRDLLGRALGWADRTHALAKLHTDQPAVYAGHGFRVVPTHRFRSAVRPERGITRRLLTPSNHPEDAELLARLLAHREPVSHQCASADPGWLTLVDAALSGRLDTAMWLLPDHEAIVVLDERDAETVVVEVIAPELPSAAVIAGAGADLALPRLYAFDPDRLEPEADPIPAPASLGALMVRGAWPATSPFGISPLWEH